MIAQYRLFVKGANVRRFRFSVHFFGLLSNFLDRSPFLSFHKKSFDKRLNFGQKHVIIFHETKRYDYGGKAATERNGVCLRELRSSGRCFIRRRQNSLRLKSGDWQPKK